MEKNQRPARPRWNIFHPSDFSPASEVAFAHALKLTLQSGAELSMLHVTATAADMDWADFPGIRQTLERWGVLPAESSREDILKRGLQIQRIIGVHSDPVQSVLHYLVENPANLVVLATHQREGLARWLHRAVAEPIARQTRAMTLFVPHSGEGFVSRETGALTLRHILVPIDYYPSPQTAIDTAGDLIRALGCAEVSFTLVHIGDEDILPAVEVSGQMGWTWETVVRQGNVVEQILQIAHDRSADLIVMTTQGHQGFLDALRGSTTEQVLRGSPCPLLAIPANMSKGFSL